MDGDHRDLQNQIDRLSRDNERLEALIEQRAKECGEAIDALKREANDLHADVRGIRSTIHALRSGTDRGP